MYTIDLRRSLDLSSAHDESGMHGLDALRRHFDDWPRIGAAGDGGVFGGATPARSNTPSTYIKTLASKRTQRQVQGRTSVCGQSVAATGPRPGGRMTLKHTSKVATA